jgi:Zn-dependent metalloprotease
MLSKAQPNKHRVPAARQRLTGAAAVVLVLFAVTSISLAQGEAPESAGSTRPYRLPQNPLEYFKAKYEIVESSLHISVTETPHGPRGKIYVRGRMPVSAEIRESGPEDRAREIALAFIRQESALLDLPDPAELRVIGVKTRPGGDRIVSVGREIGGLVLAGASIRIDVGPDDEVTRLSASLVPVSQELRRAVDKPTLGKDEVLAIVERDLLSARIEGRVKVYSGPSKAAIEKPPYVVWGVAAALGEMIPWHYTIDAFTGEVLRKESEGIE